MTSRYFVLLNLIFLFVRTQALADYRLPDLNIKINNFSGLSTDKLGFSAEGGCSAFSEYGCGGSEVHLQKTSSSTYQIHNAVLTTNIEPSIFSVFTPMSYILSFFIKGTGLGEEYHHYPAETFYENQTIQFMYLGANAHSVVYSLKGGGDASTWIQQHGENGRLYLEMSVDAKAKNIYGTHCDVFNLSDADSFLSGSHLNLPAQQIMMDEAWATSTCKLNMNTAPIAHVSLKTFLKWGGDGHGTDLLSDVEYDRAVGADLLSGLGKSIELDPKAR